MILVNSTILFFPPPNYIYTIHICNNIITHKHTRSKSKLKIKVDGRDILSDFHSTNNKNNKKQIITFFDGAIN